MPFLLTREIADATRLGIWKIEEPEAWFRNQLMLSESEVNLIAAIRNPQRKLHWLSSRFLLRTMMQTDQFIHLESDSNGKPIIHNFPVYISISHSSDLSALLISSRMQVGIDIEKIDPKIFRIEHKFLRAEEKENLAISNNKLEQLYVVWCAKEAMYKLYGQKQLDFRLNLSVSSFQYAGSGTVTGRIKKDTYENELQVHFEKLNDYMMAYVVQ